MRDWTTVQKVSGVMVVMLLIVIKSLVNYHLGGGM